MKNLVVGCLAVAGILAVGGVAWVVHGKRTNAATHLTAEEEAFAQHHLQVMFTLRNEGADKSLEEAFRQRLADGFVGRTHETWFCKVSRPATSGSRTTFSFHWSDARDQLFLEHAAPSLLEVVVTLRPANAEGLQNADFELYAGRFVPGCVTREQRAQYGRRCRDWYRSLNPGNIRFGSAAGGVTDASWDDVLHALRYMTQYSVPLDVPQDC